MSNKITIDELEKYLWGSAVLLRTHVDAGAYKQYIFPLLFFKRLSDVYDEECEKVRKEYGEEALDWEENHQFMIPDGAHWNDVRNVSKDVGKALKDAFHAIEVANPEKLTVIFGDASWTNKNRLPDRLLKDLMEHFSSKTLSIENCPADELGQGYEYLIKKFADDSGHTAQEFYTNRTVVNLMTEMLKPQPGESIYDPTCGSAGMLISAVAYLKQQKKEWRNLSIYGQEIVTLTSTIARMNLLLHGIQDFNIINADTLKNPGFIVGGKLQRFNVIFANPPYSIKQWDRTAFEKDKYGRNKYGVPPQSRADFAFIQHIISSLDKDNGRAAILLPHGVLNRTEEKEIRKKIVQSDCIEAVIGLGRHLFYNSGLESCILVLNTNKPIEKRHEILFIEAEKYQHKVQGQAFLFEDDIKIILEAYHAKQDIEGLSKHVKLSDILVNDGNLNIKSYVVQHVGEREYSIQASIEEMIQCSQEVHSSIFNLASVSGFAETVFSECRPIPMDKTNKGWKKVKLSDVAEEYSARINNPSESEFEWYIGSDCIDGFDFRIKRKTSAKKIKSAQKEFRSGDYLLVRRSLYGSDFRERAPRANFDGVCSADILTIREKKNEIADGFLICVLYCKELWKFVVANSTGSLTRRIKWNQLKDFEFYLPPYEEQVKISNVIWAAYEMKLSYQNLSEQIDELVKSQFIEMFGYETEGMKTIDDIANICRGASPRPISKFVTEDEDGVNWIKIGDVTEDDIYITHTAERITREGAKKSRAVEPGDFKLSNSMSFGRPYILGISGCVHDGWLIISDYQAHLDPLFFYYELRSDLVQRQFDGSANGSCVKNLNSDLVKKVKIHIPPMDKQKEFVEFAQQSDKSKFELKNAIETMDRLIHAFLNMEYEEV